MSFSNNAEEKIKGVQVLIEFAALVKPFFEDPKIMEKWAKEAYALPQAEAAQADEARGKIAEYRSLIAELSNKKGVLDEFNKSLLQDQKLHQEAVEKFNADCERAAAENAAARKSVEEEKAKLQESKKTLDERDVAQGIKERQLAEDSTKIEVLRSDVKKIEDAANKKLQEATEYHASLKARAVQSQQIMEGL